MGDLNGVSAEIIAKFFGDEKKILSFIPYIYGDLAIFYQWAEIFQGLKGHDCTYWHIFFQRVKNKDIVFPRIFKKQEYKISVRAGKISMQGGIVSFDCLQSAIKDTMAKKMDALVTAPINKAALQLAGIPYKGHTPLLVKMTGVSNYTMAFTSPLLSMALVTDHIPLAQVASSITKEKILQTIILCDNYAKFCGKKSPKIAVCGLNPHAGEEQILGHEEQEVIAPAIALAKKAKIKVVGPIAADSIFYRVKREKLDFIIAMYHDQGLVGWKSNFLEKSAQISLGLPIIRTSVSHGTAFDIAGLGIAKESSFAYACELACQMTK